MMKVRWTASAEQDLKNIRDYIAHDSRLYADRMVQSVLASVEGLEVFPESGALVLDRRVRGLREIFVRPYRIIYRILPECVEIMAVIHGARRLPSLPA